MNLNTVKTLNGTEDLNYIVQSSLNCYSSKGLAKNYSIKYVQNAKEYYVLDGKRYQLSQGQFLVVNPGQEVEIEVNSEYPVEGNCFFFEPQFMQYLFCSKQKSNEWNLDNLELQERSIEISNIPIHISGTALEELLKASQMQMLNTKQEVSEFLILLGESYINHRVSQILQLNNLPCKNNITSKEQYHRIQLGRSFIHDNINEEITLKDMAMASQLSVYYFHRIFRQYFKQTPHQYLQELRMKKANDLFRKKNLTNSEISYQCGYTDPKYFTKVYKKWNKNRI